MQVLRESPHRRVHQQVSLGRRRGWAFGAGGASRAALRSRNTPQASPADRKKDLHVPQCTRTFCYETLERHFILLLLPVINLMERSSLPSVTINEADITVGYMLQPIKHLVILLSLIPPPPAPRLKLLIVNVYPPSSHIRRPSPTKKHSASGHGAH